MFNGLRKIFRNLADKISGKISKETLNEIAYGDKMIVIADGEYIRVALVCLLYTSPSPRD